METTSSATTTRISAAVARARLEEYDFGYHTEHLRKMLPEDALGKLEYDYGGDTKTEIFFCSSAVAEAYNSFLRQCAGRVITEVSGYSAINCFWFNFTSDQGIVDSFRGCMSFIGTGNYTTVWRINRAIIRVFFTDNELNSDEFIDPDDLDGFDKWWHAVPYLQLLGLLKLEVSTPSE